MKVSNTQLTSVAKALAWAGDVLMPVPLALRMVALRRRIRDHLQDVEEVRASIVRRHANGKPKIQMGDAGYDRFVEEVNELFSREDLDLGDPFPLYHREGDDGNDEYAWTDDFASPLEKVSPNVLMGLMHVVSIEPVASSEDDGA